MTYVLASVENFNKSIELGQKYYKNSVQNFLSFVNKIKNPIQPLNFLFFILQ